MSELIFVGLIDPNSWNPNVMQDEEYQALKRDMQLHGPQGIDPILVSPWACFFPGEPVNERFVIVDGEHRWRVAKEVGWKEILCEVREITEDDAKGICYRRNRERGTIDPFKEATLFQSEVERKRSQKQIAEKYLVDPSTVSHRLSLLRIPPKIIETVRKLPRGTITPSHLEPIASLDLEDQRKVDLKSPYSDGLKSVKQIEMEVSRIKEMRAEEKALAEAVKTAKFPKCPKCGKDPSGIYHKGLPWVECESGHWDHSWNLTTGKTFYREDRFEEKRLSGESIVRVSSVLRSAHTVKDLVDVFNERVKEIVPKIENITNLRVTGMLDGARFQFDMNTYSESMSIYVTHGGSDQSFRAEKHDYRSGEKSAVHCGRPDDIQKVKTFIETAFQGRLGVEPRRRKKEPTP